VLITALLVMVAAVLRFMYGPPLYPRFHNYGVVQTSIGLAVVACGGEGAGQCGNTTAMVFASCSPQFHVYFRESTATDDQLVRALMGKRPPSGNRWVVECGGADAMIHGQPLAHLESD
jgi:hypothetical protein